MSGTNPQNDSILTEYNYLSGTIFNFYNYLLFQVFKNGSAYLGFARADRPWGQDALIHMRFEPEIHAGWPITAIGTNTSETLDDKYFDLYSYKVIDTNKIPSKRIFIAKIKKSETDLNNIDKYEFIDENEIGQILCDYISKDYMLVTGLNPMYYFNDLDTYDYYIFNYNKSLKTKAQILDIKYDVYYGLDLPVKLAYSLNDKYEPSTIIECGNLSRTVNVLGEYYVTGLDYNFTPDMNIFKNAWFFLLDENGVIIQDGMKFVEELETEKGKILAFEFYTLTNVKQTLYITTETKKDISLSVWNESLPLPFSAMPVADNNPPGFDVTYIRSTDPVRSVFDVRGISKIKPEEVKFCKQVKNADEEQELQSYGFDIEEITVNDSNSGTPVTVKFAITDNIDDAFEFGFDSVMIDKELDGNTPTSDVYRQLFVSIFPRDKNNQECTEDNYVGDDLFQTEEDYGFNMGVLAYLANKQPVYRKYIDGNETFKIII